MPPPRRPLVRATLGLLAFAAIVHLGFQLGLGLDPTDVGPFETVLARAVAGHFDGEVGPAGFYGPFSGVNPSVLIHAPLYYRMTAAVAWPFVRAGADPLAATLYAGRALAFLGTLLLLASAADLARLDGASPRAAAIVAALVAASPILGNLAVMLRPDAVGVGLQTFGVLLVLHVLRDGRGDAARLVLGYAAFALAFSMKQQNLTAAVVCSLLLGLAWLRGRAPLVPILAAHAAAVAVVGSDLALENVVTGGRMFRSVFVYPGGPFRDLNYAGWVHVASIFDITARRSVGLIALAGACACMPRGRPKSADRPWAGPRLDATIGLFLVVELAAMVPLCLYNAGAAYNYALQAIVFACILVGRALDRLIGTATPARGYAVALAMIVLLAADVRLIAQTASARAADRDVLAALFTDVEVTRCPASERYFVGRHHLNRLFGRADLIHDDWLYGAFERIGAAEPRDAWLRAALLEGSIRQVVAPTDAASVPGIASPLPDLGYRRIARHGDLAVWERR